MPLRTRSSGNVGRGTPQGDPPAHQPGSSQPSAARDSPPRTSTARPAPVYDESERLVAAHTELNKANAEKDKFQGLYDGANKKLSETNRQMYDLKAQTQTFKEDNQTLRELCKQLKEENEALKFSNLDWQQNYAELKARYENLTLRYNATSPPNNPMTTPLPDRPKPSRSGSKREPRDQRDDRDRDRERDRGRGRDREREKREQHKEQKEQKAEKERLSKRFDERRGPPPTNRRNSFIEGWGPGGRSSSANPSGRAYNTVATGRMQGQQVPYNVPRTSTNPLSPGLYSSSGSGSSAAYDEDTYEDGNYHPYPIAR